IARAIEPSMTPATTSSQKGLPVAITANQTQTGQSSQRTFNNRRCVTDARTTPTMSASAAWRLGIAAYGFDASSTRPLPWLRPPSCPSVSVKPMDVKKRGGAVGSNTYLMRPSTFASRTLLRKRVNALLRRRYTHSNAIPITVNSEFQYVHETSSARKWEDCAQP